MTTGPGAPTSASMAPASTVEAPGAVRAGRAPVAAEPPALRRLIDRLGRVPTWLWVIGGLAALTAISAYIRSRYLSGQFWMDEAITTGISLHPLSAIPGILRHDGNPPSYYMLLHVWMSLFGSSESAVHSLDLVIGLLCIPAGGWTAWSLFGRRTAIMATVLFAFNAWLTAYSQENRMYVLAALLGILLTGGFIHGFVFRRRRYLVLFSAMLALMLYTHTWGTFVFAGSALALIPAYIASEDRRALLRDAVIAFGAAGVLYLPWAPTLLYQVGHTAAPWDHPPRFGAPVQISRNLLGGDRITMVLVLSAAVGLGPLFARSRRRSPEWVAAWTLIALPVAVLGLAWIESQINPAWASRYFAPILGAILLLIAWGCARARLLGMIAILAAVGYLANSSFAPQWKSDMRDVAGEMAPMLHPGDVVLVGQPEQTPLAFYYLPAGLRYANTAGGFDPHPSYMNWVDALARLRDTRPETTLATLVSQLRPGQKLLFIRPLTEGAQNWEAPWVSLLRRRSAQWGEAFDRDVAAGVLAPIAVAPHFYRGACCVGNSAVLYRRS